MDYQDVRLKRLQETLERLIMNEGNEFAFSVIQSMNGQPPRIAFSRIMAQVPHIRAFLDELDYIETGKRDFKTVD